MKNRQMTIFDVSGFLENPLDIIRYVRDEMKSTSKKLRGVRRRSVAKKAAPTQSFLEASLPPAEQVFKGS
uniref:Uncharacterized protein n=1 Tax=Dulem virus 87 TaxID=3145798 RepID=A0AAU8B0Z2_9VIRU